MRTTLTIQDDLIVQAKKRAISRHENFKDVINDAIRLGLEKMNESSRARPYKTKPQDMTLKAGFSYDNIAELLAQAEGENFR